MCVCLCLTVCLVCMLYAVFRDYMVKDRWPVIAEDFSQWVVEDSFCNGKPAWDKVRTEMAQHSTAEHSNSR